MIFFLIETLAIVEQSNEDAFETFVSRFDRRYQNAEERAEAFRHFVHNYQNLLKHADCEYCGMNHFMDRDFSEMLGGEEPMSASEAPLGAFDCVTYICTATNPLPDIASPHADIDLREAGTIVDPKNQGSCGSCYAFSTVAVLQSLVLQDQAQLKKKLPFWTFTRLNLSISEQYLLSNDFVDGYCSGGSFSRTVNNVFQVQKTVELTSNFAYDPTANQAKWTAKTAVAPKIAAANYLIPLQGFTNIYDTTGPKVASIEIYRSTTAPFTAAAVKTIKSYLSRGLALSVGMYVSSNSSFYYYTTSKGQVLYEACPQQGKTNHAVTLVGYGKKGGKNVWIVANSWGTTTWGDRGVFFIEQGKNAFCLENRVYAAIPKYMNITSTTTISRGSLAYRGLSYGLDKATTSVSPVVFASIAVAAVAVIAAVLAVAFRAKTQSKQGYVVITNEVL